MGRQPALSVCRAIPAGLKRGLFGKGIGFRLSGIYTGETRLDGSGLPGSTDLFFDDIVTFNLRVFANLAELTGKEAMASSRIRG